MKSPSSAAIPPGVSSRRVSPLAAGIAALLIAALPARAQTYTSPNSGTFTNPLVWNFGAGPVPASDATLALWLQTYGAFQMTAGNDLNLTLNALNLATYGSGALTVSNAALNGDFAFTGGAGTVNLLGSGATSTLSAGMVLGQGLTSLTFDGAGASGLTISGIIASTTASGAPLIIATDAGDAGTGVITLNGVNTFAGGVVLNSGTLNLTNTRALGERTNILTINGGDIRGSVTLANNITLNGTLSFNGSDSNLSLAGVLGGTGGVASHASAAANGLVLSGINTYSGPTEVGGLDFASTAQDGAGNLTISGAAGSILNTPSIAVRDGGAFIIRTENGNSAANARISTGTAINTRGGFLEVFGTSVAGIVRQNIGPVNAGGLTTFLAATGGATTTLAGAGTEITISNLVRTPGATVTFSGPNLGSAAVVAGTNPAQGNVILTQINGTAPGAALVGGGGPAGTTTISILPWALGDTGNTSKNSAAGSGFVTHGTNGVRLLNATTEYNTSNNFNGLADNFQNMRVSGPATGPTGATTVNSLLLNGGFLSLTGVGPLTITSGALASSGNNSIALPIIFGTGGTGEAVISVTSPLASPSALRLDNSSLTAGSLVKNGHGTLFLNGPLDVSGPLTINAGQVSVQSVSVLAGFSAIKIDSQSNLSRSGLSLENLVTETLVQPITTSSGHATFNISNPDASLTLNSDISGAGGVRKDGAGTLTLGGTNSYAGGTFISGTLVIDSDARLGSTADPLRNFVGFGAGTLRLTGNWSSARAISMGAGVLDTQTNTATLSGPISGTFTFTKVGSGPLKITGNDNAFSGLLTLGTSGQQGGTLALVGAGALNAANVTFGVSNSPSGTYLLDLSAATDNDPSDGSPRPWRSFASLNTGGSGTFTQAHEVRLGATALTPVDLRVNNGTFGSATGAGSITGFGKLIKVGANSNALTLQSANSFTGGVEIWGGLLFISNDNQLGNSSNSVSILGGALSAETLISTNRNIVLGATPVPIISTGTALTLPNSIDNLRINGVVSGAGGFETTGVSLGPSVVVLNNPGNTYQGDTQIGRYGTISFAVNGNLGAASSRVRLGDGGTLSYSGTAAITLPRTIIHTGNDGDGTTFDAGSSGGSVDLSGQLLGVSRAILVKVGTDTLTLSGDNRSFFGLLQVGTYSGAAGNLTIAATGQLRRGGLNLTLGSASTCNLSGLTREFGAISTAAGTTLALGSGGKVTAGFNESASAIAGAITGDSAASYSHVGANVLTLSGGGHTFGGGFHVLSGVGNATFSGNGALPLQSAFTLGAWGSSSNAGPKLTLNNAATNLGTRLADTQRIHSNAGELQFTTNATAASSETAGALRGAGMTTVTMTTGGTLNFGDALNGLTRSNGGTFLFRAGNASLGTAAASTTVPRLTFGNLPGAQLLGGGGVAGTTSISILPYAVGGIAATDTGSGFVTYGANGVRVLNTTTEVTASLTAATTTENVRLANATLTVTALAGGADQTVNALNLAGTANTTRIESAGVERLILNSGLLLNTVANVSTFNAAGTAGISLGVQTAELQTGAGNSRELNVFTTGGDLALGAKVTTTGGLTKSGAAQLFLTNGANSYSGATTINAGRLVIDSLAALGGSGALQIGGGFLKYRGGDAVLTQGIIAAGGSALNDGGSAGFDIVGGTTLTVVPGGVSGYGGILKDGSGVLKLTGANTHSGATIISGGTLAIDNPATLGTNRRVIFADGISTFGGQSLRFDAPLTLTQDFINNTAQTNVGFGFNTNGHDVTLSGTILSGASFVAGARGLYKLGAGELNLTATEMYTGATQIFGGTLRLSGAAGSVLNSTGTGGFNTNGSVVIAPGSALILDNAAANNNNRLPDVWDTPFGSGNAASGRLVMNGGEFKIIGHAAGTSERINQFDILTGTITLQGGGTTVTSGLFNRTNGSSAGLIRGTNLGALPGAASANWFVTDLGSGGVRLGGAGGAEGTPFVNLLPGFMGAASASGSGTDFLTYAADTGFRLLTAGEYTATIAPGNFDLNRAPNVALTGAATVNLTTAISALKLGAGASVSGSGTLVLGQFTVLATGNAAVDVGTLSSNPTGLNGGYIFLTSGATTTLTVSSALPSTGLTKYGEGTLEFNGRFTGGGSVIIGQGTLKLSGSGALHPLNSVAMIMPGASLDLGGSDRTISQFATTASVGTFGLGQVSDGTVALGANRLTIYVGGGTFTGDITGTGGVTKPFFSTGTDTFTQPLSYTGRTVVRRGTIQLAGAGTLASTAVEIRGGTLLFNNADDNAASGYVADRLGTGVPVTLAGGGLTFTENANTPGNHHLGPVILEGSGTLTVTNGSAAPSTVTIANLTRNAAHGTLEISATNLGLTPSPAGNARVFLTQVEGGTPTGALIGGGGAVGTTTQSILPWAFYNPPSSFLTYGADGLRPLQTSEYETNLDSPSSAGANIRKTTVQNLTAPRIVNSLINQNGNVGGAFDLTIASGALTDLAGSTLGVAGKSLFTGAGNTRELFVRLSGVLSTLNYNVNTSGGLTLSGSGALTLAGVNGFGGGLTVNGGAVAFSSDANLGAAGGLIRFGALGDNTTLSYTGPASVPLIFTRPVETTAHGAFGLATGQVWRIDSVISGVGGIGYKGTGGVFEINGANIYAGPTNWTGNHLYIRGDSAFGDSGELLLNPNNTLQQIVLRGGWNTGRLIHAVSANGLQTNGFDAVWSGQFIGSGPFQKNGQGRLILTAPMGFSGPLTVRAGELRLSERGSLAANPSTLSINAGATLLLDDTAAHFSDRLADSSGGVLLAGGTLHLAGSSSAPTEEVINNLTLNATTVSTVTLAPGSGQAAILRLTGAVTVNAGASLWRGTDLGMHTPGTANSASLLLTPANTGTFPLVGGGAPAAHPSISIISGGFGDSSASGLGTQLVTYDSVKGLRLLNPATEYTSTLLNGSVVTDNVKADGTALALAHATTANALWLKDGGSVTGAGVLSLTSGTLLATGAGNLVSAPLNLAGAAFAVGGPGDVTVTGAISGATFLAKQGAGTLTLNNPASSLTRTIFAGGVIAVGHSGALGAGAVNGEFQGGEIRNVSGAPLALALNLTLNGPMKVGGTQDLNFTGTVSLANATREINVTNTGTTTLSGILSSSQSLVSYGLDKTGPGRLVLANIANTYDGETAVSAGELRVTGSIASSTLTTIRGGTLSGTGTVGPLTLETGVLAPGASAGTLNCGDLLLRGGIFAVEIASAVSADQLNVTGTAGLAANTELDLFTLGLFDPQIGDSWVIVNNDGSDAFNMGASRFTNDGALIEDNAPFTVSGETYVLRYHAGTGNDVVLTAAVPEPAAIALLLAGLPLLLRRRTARRPC